MPVASLPELLGGGDRSLLCCGVENDDENSKTEG